MRKFERMSYLENPTCDYCGTPFIPKKRFVQKYCCNSCNVQACRERKNGYLSGIGKDTKNSISNAKLSEQLAATTALLRGDLKAIKTNTNWLLIIEGISVIKQFWDRHKLKTEAEKQATNLNLLKIIIEKQFVTNKKDIEILKEMAKSAHPEMADLVDKLM